MKNYIQLFSLSVFSILFLNAKSQDLHFSQFNENPSLINPALTGAAHVIRASAIYKDQWRSITVPYKTFGASFEMKFKASAWDKVGNHETEKYKKAFNRLAGGLSFYSDKAGDGSMGTTNVNLSLATFIPVNKKSSISVGLQASVVQKKVDYTKFIWPDQYNGSTYDASAASGESYTTNNFIYPDFAGGLLYTYGYNEKAIGANNQFRFEFGVSMYHLASPKLKYLSQTSERLYSKQNIHGKCLVGIRNTNVSLMPSFLFSYQGATKEMIEGIMIRHSFKDDSKYTGFIKASTFSYGGFYRNKDAFIAVVQMEFAQYSIAFSYDINTSKLTKVSGFRGGPEITLRFVSPSPYLYQKSKAKFN
jgi:type IX secretion system PorP/SprF family membrane protein